jgi:hypothetical protein
MAMTKKEREEMEALRRELAIASAFRMTDPVDRDLPPPTDFSDLSRGWDFNAHNRSVEKACSSCVHHGSGWERTNTQRPAHLYSTERRAWLALRYAIARQAAAHLAEIDARIAALKE